MPPWFKVLPGPTGHRLRNQLIAAVLIFTVPLMAFSCANIGAYINLGATFALDILQIIAAFRGQGVSAGEIAAVQKYQGIVSAVWSDVQAAWNAYEATKGTTGLSKLQAALQAAYDGIPKAFSDAGLPQGAVYTRIEASTLAFVNLIRTIAAFKGIQLTPPATLSARATAKLTPAKLSIGELKSQWNLQVATGIPNAQIN